MNKSNLIIGFTNKFFTLWSISNNEFNDETGYCKITTYSYIKNISFDEDKVRSEYPGVEIDMSLRGHSSFSKTIRIEDPNKFQYGKYKGDMINECTDYSYMMWYYNDGCSDGNKESIKSILLPLGYEVDGNYIIDPNEVIKRNEYNKEVNNELNKFNGNSVIFVAERNLGIEGEYNYGFNILIKFVNFEEKSYNGWPYALPTINGKAKRIKNKNIKLVDYTVSFDGIWNVITVNKFEIIK